MRTAFAYAGELGADLWALGEWWGGRVAKAWERTVAGSLGAIQAEAERRAPLTCGLTQDDRRSRRLLRIEPKRSSVPSASGRLRSRAAGPTT